MRKDKINQDALEKAYLIYAEQGHRTQDYAHKPTDYARGTVLEPEATSQLKSNFGEYDMLGERCKEICSEIDELKEGMKVARMRGNFQELQQQMKLVNNLTKEKSAIEAKMATLDLARQQDDSHKRMMGMEPSYSEQIGSVEAKIAELEAKLTEFAEGSDHPFDFTTCQRKDGSRYGTNGKCRKGTETTKTLERDPSKDVKRGSTLIGTSPRNMSIDNLNSLKKEYEDYKRKFGSRADLKHIIDLYEKRIADSEKAIAGMS